MNYKITISLLLAFCGSQGLINAEPYTTGQKIAVCATEVASGFLGGGLASYCASDSSLPAQENPISGKLSMRRGLSSAVLDMLPAKEHKEFLVCGASLAVRALYNQDLSLYIREGAFCHGVGQVGGKICFDYYNNKLPTSKSEAAKYVASCFLRAHLIVGGFATIGKWINSQGIPVKFDGKSFKVGDC